MNSLCACTCHCLNSTSKQTSSYQQHTKHYLHLTFERFCTIVSSNASVELDSMTYQRNNKLLTFIGCEQNSRPRRMMDGTIFGRIFQRSPVAGCRSECPGPRAALSPTWSRGSPIESPEAPRALTLCRYLLAISRARRCQNLI